MTLKHSRLSKWAKQQLTRAHRDTGVRSLGLAVPRLVISMLAQVQPLQLVHVVSLLGYHRLRRLWLIFTPRDKRSNTSLLLTPAGECALVCEGDSVQM